MKLTLSHVFDAPGPHPNGLQASTEGLWILDQGDNRISLHDYRDGATLRIFDSDSDRGSGITHSGVHLWVSSTYSCETLKIDPGSGRTLKRYATPGAKKTGAHGLEWRDGELWMSSPPDATIYRMDPDAWTVLQSFPAPGDRPHGIAWDNGRLWCVETNHRALFLYDPDTARSWTGWTWRDRNRTGSRSGRMKSGSWTPRRPACFAARVLNVRHAFLHARHDPKTTGTDHGQGTHRIHRHRVVGHGQSPAGTS